MLEGIEDSVFTKIIRMKKDVNISLSPEDAANDEIVRKRLAQTLSVDSTEITAFYITRRSVDARGRNLKMNLGVQVYVGEEPSVEAPLNYNYQNVQDRPSVIIVGAGPAGLFAAMRLIEFGLRPVIFERGKDVASRKHDIAAIHRNEGVNPNSNYGFGEGGAGTFSDGKLFTRSKKRGNTTRILQLLHEHGAKPEILIDAHPHIGTNVLPRIVKNIREMIINAGGEVNFNSKVSDLLISGDKVEGVVLENGRVEKAAALILATGHSARDIYNLLQQKNIALEAKNFAVGVRVEHRQSLIDSIQYHQNDRGIYLPPASYSFVEQVKERGVYSFCMCPGGSIVPAATAVGELVVNGMSPSMRNGKFANSGLVVEVRLEDLKQYQKYGAFTGLKFQEELEQKAFEMADRSMLAPAQRLTDFIEGRKSNTLPETSYHPGLSNSELHKWLPSFVAQRLRAGLRQMGNKARGFVNDEASVIGVESRTSSPVRIPRNPDTLAHIELSNLFPCGEGAGYAGGIVSSAIDGERCAEMVAVLMGACSYDEIRRV